MANSTGASSSFPTSIDTFTQNAEIQSNDISDITEFESLQLIENKTDTQIARYNALLTQYYDKIFTALKLNHLQDCIISMETFTKSNFLNYLRYRGTWDSNISSSSTPYRIFNIVLYKGNTYIALIDYPTSIPTNTSEWVQNSSDGSVYSLNIVGTVGTIIYDENGYNPSPNMSTLSCTLYENGNQVTPTSYSWTTPSINTLISGSSITATFTPAIASQFDATKGNNVVTLTVVYNGQTLKRHFPIAITKVGAKGTPGVGIGLSFKGAYNDQQTYLVNQCVQYLGNVYACIQDVQGILPTNTTYWSLAVAKGGSTILTTYRNSVTLTGDATNVPIGISTYNQYTDTLLVYAQKLYQEIGQDYKINVNGTSIDKMDSTTWLNGTVFYFVVIKNVVTDMTYADGGMLQDKTVSIGKLTQDVQDKINNNSFSVIESNYTAISDGISEVSIGNSLYNPSTDDFEVKYYNEVLTKGVNYNVSNDNLKIELIDWTLNNGDIVYFKITKKSINLITQTDGSLIQEKSIAETKLTQGLQDKINGIKIRMYMGV